MTGGSRNNRATSLCVCSPHTFTTTADVHTRGAAPGLPIAATPRPASCPRCLPASSGARIALAQPNELEAGAASSQKHASRQGLRTCCTASIPCAPSAYRLSHKSICLPQNHRIDTGSCSPHFNLLCELPPADHKQSVHARDNFSSPAPCLHRQPLIASAEAEHTIPGTTALLPATMSQFISLLPPTASLSASYDPTKLAADQPARDIPTTFKDAMTVRERVFVEEQGVPLENEFDDDDPRCFHWVVYASVGTSSSSNGNGSNSASPLSNGTHNDSESPSPQEERRQSDPTANRVAVGTIRLVPPPHPPHPAPSDHHKLDNSLHAPATGMQANGSRASEPYIKLGRLAVLPAYRKLGLAALLMRTALDWAAQNSYQILSPPRPEEVELAKAEGRDVDLESWNGLALVHAQIQLERFYSRFGFVKDEEMGEWDEEGIQHIGMWSTLKLRE